MKVEMKIQWHPYLTGCAKGMHCDGCKQDMTSLEHAWVLDAKRSHVGYFCKACVVLMTLSE